MSAERFMYRFIAAIRGQRMIEFKEQLRRVDVLMVDDLQFLMGKDATQEEFFHTFNALVDAGKQIVVSADKSPSDLSGLEERVRTRLGSGIVANLHAAEGGISEDHFIGAGSAFKQTPVDSWPVRALPCQMCGSSIPCRMRLARPIGWWGSLLHGRRTCGLDDLLGGGSTHPLREVFAFIDVGHHVDGSLSEESHRAGEGSKTRWPKLIQGAPRRRRDRGARRGSTSFR